MSHRSPSRVVLAGVGLAALAAGLITPIARADTRTPVYIALGDSYTAAPLSSKPVGTWGGEGGGYANPDDPYTCGRSDRNYPHLIAQHLGLYDPNDLTKEIGEHPEHPGFIDISCGSAQTMHMTEPQEGLPGGGYAVPQFDAFARVNPETEVVKLVSIGIGGNDLGFGELTDYCIQPPEAAGGTPCRVHYENEDLDDDGYRDTNPEVDGDILQDRLLTLRSALDELLEEIHVLAPEAEVLVFGYPALLPEHRDGLPPELADGCYPYIPILPTDTAYLREVEKDLNDTIHQAAIDNDAHYVDWYTPSMGHDMCQPPGLAWVNGVVLAPPSYPVHPNVLGSQGAATAGIEVLEALS
ncbi:MAG: SGNH/GDSL hydrolase family protein [Microthrixaceae bacterium]